MCPRDPGLSSFAGTVRLSSSALHPTMNVATALPRLFVGSSSEALPVARVLEELLERDATVIPWTADVFEPGGTTIESLLTELERADFAVLIFAPDDQVLSRQAEHLSVRDNVLFEAGLFMGRLGRH